LRNAQSLFVMGLVDGDYLQGKVKNSRIIKNINLDKIMLETSTIVSFFIGAVLGGAAAYLFCKIAGSAETPSLIQEQTEAKADNLARVMEMIKSQGRATNNDVERLLGVSDATATRYLDELEKAGKIRQVGDTGQAVYYIPVDS